MTVAHDADALYLGMISGTSADAIDAALVRFGARPALVAASATPYPAALRSRLLELAQNEQARMSLEEYGTLDAEVGELFAEVANALIGRAGVPRARVRAIGSHGQTIRHRPRNAIPFTLQLGDANRIAERTGITTVADFRRRDVAAGGEGAPLMCAFHAAVLRDAGEPRAVLNLGGIANLTLLEHGLPVRGFDTGPANAILDAWCQQSGRGACDEGGRFAASGTALPTLLALLHSDPYFARSAPKSTGREQFHLAWLRRAPGLDAHAPADVAATLVALTAATVAEALTREAPGCRRVIACGGGVHNPTLMAALSQALAPVHLDSSAAHGIDPDYMEAMGFAWLARETLAGRPGNLPEVTGARGLRVLGAIHAGG